MPGSDIFGFQSIEAFTAAAMVEAAGIEPASAEVRTRTATRLPESFFHLARGAVVNMTLCFN